MKAYLEIEMPACINCRFCQAGDSTSYCLAQSHELERGGWYMHNIKWDEGIGYEAQKTWREKTCPLVPVQPHGRLINVDDLETVVEQHFKHHKISRYDRDLLLHYLDIEMSPTIIPEDKDGE